MDVYCIVNQTICITAPTKKIQLHEPLAYNNSLAHAMRVTVQNDDGTDADLAGMSVTAAFLKSNNETVYPILGTVDGSVAQVILEPSCYVTPGRFKFTMNLNKPTPTTGIATFSTSTSYAKGAKVVYGGVVYRFTVAHSAGAWTGTDAVPDGASRTALWVEGIVERNTSATIIDPGTPVGNIDTAINNATAAAADAISAAYDAAIATIAAQGVINSSVRYDTDQTLTDSQKTRARNNIGAADNAHFPGTGRFVVGTDSDVSSNNAAAIGWGNTSSAPSAQAMGSHTIANHAAQHAFGAYNEPDPSENGAAYRGNYIEIVGNGLSDESRSNARTLDWSGNEVLAGSLTIGGDEALTKAELQRLKGMIVATIAETEAYLGIGTAT